MNNNYNLYFLFMQKMFLSIKIVMAALIKCLSSKNKGSLSKQI